MTIFRYVVRAEATTRELLQRYERWLGVEGHVAEVVRAGALRGEVVRIDGEPPRIEVHYTFASRAAFAAYERDHAPRLRAEGLAKFPSGITFARTSGDLVAKSAQPALEVVPIPCLKDNYAYLVVDRAAGEAVVVDPSEAEPVLARLAEEGVRLSAIWCTHHHLDHVGGNEALVRAIPGLTVIGSRFDEKEKRIPGLTRAVGDGDVVSFGGHEHRIVEIPGHTLGAIAFVSDTDVFTGDTLFLAGCGRVFEGTMPMMRASLEALGALDPELRVWCGHEYTVRNLEFAEHVEPDNAAVKTRLAWARAMRAKERATVPGRLGDELGTNPFLRSTDAAVTAFAKQKGDATSADEVFARVREAKNAF
jgi:hydroxyacylglutathione hydrolase